MVANEPLSSQRCDAWVVFTHEKLPLLPPLSDPVLRRLARMVQDWIRTTGFTGRPNEVAAFPAWDTLPARFVVLAGLGAKRGVTVTGLQRAMASAARRAAKMELRRLATALLPRGPGWPCDPAHAARMLVAGFHSGRYDFEKFLSTRKSPRARRTGKPSLVLTGASARRREVVRAAVEADAAAEILKTVRDLANLPANEATPAVLAARARALARAHGVKCAVADETALRRDRCLSVLAVGQGSANPPRLVTLTYPGKRRKEPPVVLVGKTITFDTGGISIKPSRNMEWMKYDKSGGMAALAAVLLAARLKLDHPVVAILAMAENMPGSRATRPGDIVRSRSGKTIEIINTDAEGRLVLADALSIAAGLRPRAIVDLATLTGACVVALGHVAAGVMGNDETLLKGLQAAGDAAGERLWPLPLLPEYGEALKTPFADLKNVGEEGAGAIVGGAFLEAFVPAGVPWAHIDIAGTAWEEREKPYGAPGATLFGPGLLVEWIRRLPPKR